MKMRLKPLHEAMLTGLLMIVALTVLVAVLAHDYPARLPQGEAAEIYQGPVQHIRGASRRLRSRLGASEPLADLDALYEDRVLVPVEETPVPEAVVLPPVVEEVAPSNVSFRVTGIAWSPRRPMAFVNGRGVTPGAVVDGWTVGAITEHGVTLRDGDGNEQRVGLYTKRGKSSESESPVDDGSHDDAEGSKAESDAAY